MSSTHARDRERTLDRPRDERKQSILDRLSDARAGTWSLIDQVTDADASKQHSPLMSPLIWDLAHIGNFEELWLVQHLGERDSLNPLYDQMYDAFKNARRDRINLPLLNRDQCREYLQLVREQALENLDRVTWRQPIRFYETAISSR